MLSDSTFIVTMFVEPNKRYASSANFDCATGGDQVLREHTMVGLTLRALDNEDVNPSNSPNNEASAALVE